MPTQWAAEAAREIIETDDDGALFRRIRIGLEQKHGGRYPGIDREAQQKTYETLAEIILKHMPKD